jgi:hypothetical protein
MNRSSSAAFLFFKLAYDFPRLQLTVDVVRDAGVSLTGFLGPGVVDPHLAAVVAAE